MKILVVTLGSLGDLLPFIAVGEALRARGHRVVFASNAGYAALVKMAGFEFFAIWDKTLSQHSLDDTLDSNPAAAWRLVQREMFVPATEPTYQFVASMTRNESCIVLASWSAFGARLAREKLNIPLCSVYLSPYAWQEDRHHVTSSPDRGLIQSPGCAVGFFPEWFSSAQHGLSTNLRLIGFPLFEDASVPALPKELTGFLESGSPPIIFTPGSFVRRAEDFFRDSLVACENLKARAIFLTPHSSQILADLPPTAIHCRYVSLQRLADKALALVYHGGIGTCVQAMRAGIPQLIVPFFFDQFDNADRVESLGIGKKILPDRYDGITAAEQLDHLLQSDAVKRSCLNVSTEFRMKNPIWEMCEIVEAMA